MSQQVVEALLNNETYFFRDRAPFDLLQRYALPELAQRRARERSACGSGRRAARPARKSIRWRCCSPRSRSSGTAGRSTFSAPTSRPRASIARAPAAYSQFEVQRGLGINQMIKWFEECADGWRAVEALRKPVRFQVHNLLEPPPHPGGFDIVLCRNVLLYLSPEKKALAFERLAGGDGRGRLAHARRRRDGDRPDQQARRRHQCPRPLSPRRRRQPRREAQRSRSRELPRGLDPIRPCSCAIAARGWISSSGLRRISTSGSCRSR